MKKIAILAALCLASSIASANSMLELWPSCPKSWSLDNPDPNFNNNHERVGLYSGSIAFTIRTHDDEFAYYSCMIRKPIDGWSPRPIDVSCHEEGQSKSYDAKVVIKKLNAIMYSVKVEGRGDLSLLGYEARLLDCRELLKGVD